MEKSIYLIIYLNLSPKPLKQLSCIACKTGFKYKIIIILICFIDAYPAPVQICLCCLSIPEFRVTKECSFFQFFGIIIKRAAYAFPVEKNNVPFNYPCLFLDRVMFRNIIGNYI